MHKGSGFFNMCIGKKCAAESPRKTPRNTFKVNNPMKSVIKKVENLINNNNNNNKNLNEKNLKFIEKLKKSIEQTKRAKEQYTIQLRRKNIELFDDMITSYQQAINAIKSKNDTKVSRQLLNSIEERQDNFIKYLKNLKKEKNELLNELNN